MIPLKYNFRNLTNRWISTCMTVLGIGLVVWAAVLTFGMVIGLEHALRITGDPLDLIVMRKGSDSETSSTITEEMTRQIATLEGIAIDAEGKPMLSSEFVTILTKPRRNGAGTTNLIVRGLEGSGRLLRPHFRVTEGRDLTPGKNEAITSRNMAERFENLRIGEQIDVNTIPFTVVGYFEAGGSAAESEVWTDARDLTAARRTPGAVSIVNLRGTDAETLAQIQKRLETDDQFKLQAVTEPKYFEQQMTAPIAVRIVSYVIAGFLTFGAMFAAANTMYAAVAGRSREIATLRAIGFSRFSILASFMLESILICMVGGALGCLLTLPFNGISSGTANWATFSELTFAFRFGWEAFSRGLTMALAMGLLGGLFPAIRAIRMKIVDGLRQG